MDIQVDIDELQQRAKAHAERMYGPDDPRREEYEARFFHQEYMKLVTPPPAPSFEERALELLTEIRNLLR